jgi:ubiquinone biosynthesis protein
MLKALSTVEALGSTLDPDFDMATHAAPSIRRIQRERFHPRRVAADMFDTGAEFVHLLKEIPRELREILKQARQGKVKLEFEHRGLESMLTTHDRISNRIAFAIVLASQMVWDSCHWPGRFSGGWGNGVLAALIHPKTRKDVKM